MIPRKLQLHADVQTPRQPYKEKQCKSRVGTGSSCNPRQLDDGIRDTVILLWEAGFKTFTSCEGGKGHSFCFATIGLELHGDYSAFQRKIVQFLHSQGKQNFSISLVTDYQPDYSDGRSHVYLEGLDLLSEDKKRKVIKAVKRKERKLLDRLLELGIKKTNTH